MTKDKVEIRRGHRPILRKPSRQTKGKQRNVLLTSSRAAVSNLGGSVQGIDFVNVLEIDAEGVVTDGAMIACTIQGSR
jgi:hypothetical protein